MVHFKKKILKRKKTNKQTKTSFTITQFQRTTFEVRAD